MSFMRNSLYIILVLFVISNFNVSFSQLDSIHYLPPLHSRVNSQVEDHYLYLSTPETTPFTVTITDGAGNLLTSMIISNGSPARYDIGYGQLSGSQLFVPRDSVFRVLQNKGLIVKGDDRFFAEVRVRSASQAESYTGKGVSGIGSKFRLGGFPQVFNGSNDRNFTVGIFSLDNNNLINISDLQPGVTFIEPIGSNTPPGNLSFTLNAGETFVLTGYTDSPANLDGILGALVESSGSIVITNGNINGSIHPTSGSRDIGLDQIVPIDKLGYVHAVVEGNGNAFMERPLVIAHYDNTAIYVNGNPVPLAVLNAGEYFLIPNSNYQGTSHRNMYIETSNSAYVYQALAGGGSDANGGLNLIPPIHCRLSNTVNLIPDINKIGNSTYTGGLFILTEAGSNVYVNGVLQLASEAVIGANYETYKITGVSGDQVIVSDGSLMVGVFGSSGAAAYSGYYSSFADIVEGKAFIDKDVVCADDLDSVVFVGQYGYAPYHFYYTLNGDSLSAISNSDTLKLTVDNSLSDTLVYKLYSISSFDVDGTNLCESLANSQDSIIVLPLPTATISGSSTVCVNDAAPAVTFTGANGTAPYIFTYSLNGGPNQTITSTGNVATITVPTTASGTFNYDLISVEDASALTCSQAQTGTVNVQVNPLPTATITGTNQVCENSPTQTITFTGADGTAPYTFTYSYNGGAPQTIVSTGNVATISVPTTTPGTFYYELLSVSDASATVCSQVQTGNSTVTVLPLPTATISGDDIVCINSPEPVVTFTGANGTAPYIFTYSLNGGPNQTITSTGNVATINVPTTVNGTFSYTLVSVEDASALTCNQAQTGTVEVVVNPLPTATIIGDASVCNGAPEPVVTFTGADGTAPYTFTYNVNGGPNQTVTSTGNTATLNVLTAISGTYDYELISVQDNSSTACIQNQTGTISVEINPIPTASFENIGTCLNTASQFTNSSTVPAVNGANLTAWSWDFGDGNTSNLENPTHTYSDEEVYDVTLTVTSNHGCTNTTTGTGTVYPLPQVSFSPTSVCLDSNTVFTDLSSISNDHTSNTLTDWAWDFGDGTSSTLQNPTHTYAGAGTYTATLTVTSNHGCVSTLTETVIVHPKPTADFSGMNLRGCSPFCAELNSNAVVANPSSVAHYSWTLSNGETHESNQSFFGPCFENNGGSIDFIDVQLTVTTNEGCQNTFEIPNMIEVYHNPIADFFTSPDTIDVYDPVVDFSNTSQYADQYQWFIFGEHLTNEHLSYEFPAEPGHHEITLVANTDEGCYDTISRTIEILDKIIFYVPNTFTPDGRNFNETFVPVFTSGYDPEDYYFAIFNRWGERIFETNEPNLGWDGRDLRTGQEVLTGTYIWKIEFKETMSTKRHIEHGHVNLLK